MKLRKGSRQNIRQTQMERNKVVFLRAVTKSSPSEDLKSGALN